MEEELSKAKKDFAVVEKDCNETEIKAEKENQRILIFMSQKSKFISK